MANNSNKIIILILISISMILLFFFIQEDIKTTWTSTMGFELRLTGEIEDIEEFYISLEKRLVGYPDWINNTITGELTNFQKDYNPFNVPSLMFDVYNTIYTSIDLTDLLLKYSIYFENKFLYNTSVASNEIKIELNRILDFFMLLNSHLLGNEKNMVSELTDKLKYGINPYYDSVDGSQTIYIFLHSENNSQLKEIKTQIEIEIIELNKTVNVDYEIKESNFQIALIEIKDLREMSANLNTQSYSHLYKYLPLADVGQFNNRMGQLKKNIHNERFNSISTAHEFLSALAKIEEQLIEFQYRENYKSKQTTNLINKLVGDGTTEPGVLTTMINLFDDRRYSFKISAYLSNSSEYLKTEVKQMQTLVYPNFQLLPNKLINLFFQDTLTIIYKIN